MYFLFCTQGGQSGLGKGSALGLAACAALQGLLVGRKGLGRCRRGQVDARQDGGVDLLHLHRAQRGGVGRGVPRGDDAQRVGQGFFAIAAGVQPEHGALGGFQCGGIAGVLKGEAARIGQDGVVQQAGEVVLLGGQIAVLQVGFEGDQNQILAGVGPVGGQQVGQQLNYFVSE